MCGTTTHLVINEPKGQKYDHAKIWKINIISSAWVYDSIKEQYCLPEKKYALTDNQTSTPTESKVVSKTKGSLKDIDLSVIGASNISLSTNLKRDDRNETVKFINDTENERTQMNSSLNNTTIVNGFTNAFQNKASSLARQSNVGVTKTSSSADMLKELNSLGKVYFASSLR